MRGVSSARPPIASRCAPSTASTRARTCLSSTPTSASTAGCACPSARLTLSSRTPSLASRSGSSSTARLRRSGRTSRPRRTCPRTPGPTGTRPGNSTSTFRPSRVKATEQVRSGRYATIAHGTKRTIQLCVATSATDKRIFGWRFLSKWSVPKASALICWRCLGRACARVRASIQSGHSVG